VGGPGLGIGWGGWVVIAETGAVDGIKAIRGTGLSRGLQGDDVEDVQGLLSQENNGSIDAKRNLVR